MATQASEVKVGEYFMAGKKKDQLRKVTKLVKDDKKRPRVHYIAKSANFINRKFGFGPNLSNPPLMATFVKACDRRLSTDEVKQLRKSGVLLSDE